MPILLHFYIICKDEIAIVYLSIGNSYGIFVLRLGNAYSEARKTGSPEARKAFSRNREYGKVRISDCILKIEYWHNGKNPCGLCAWYPLLKRKSAKNEKKLSS